MKKFYNNYLNNKLNETNKSLFAITCLIVVITGMFGFLYEYIFYYFNSGMKEFYWRGANFLPWINIYATGSLMIWILTNKYKKKPIFIFLISVISTGILEYFSGYFMLKTTGLRCWDYNKEILSFGSINGFVCLRSVLIFGIFSLLLMYIVLPICYYLESKINKKVFFIISLLLFIIFISDELYNLIIARILSLPRASTIYKSLGIKYMKYRYK